MFANYHTHTYRCNHASGTEEEYILRAIDCGITEMGFSDHAPFKFPNGYESPHRIPTALAEEYIETLRALREKYKDKIRLHIGFELEYYPLYFEDMLNYYKKLGAEYLILGQHFLKNEIDSGFHSMEPGHTKEEFIQYTDTIITAMKTGKFTYVAHPDMFLFIDDEAFYRSEARRLCETALQTDTPLEINLLGICDNRCYPNPIFWEIAGELGNKVIFGMDAHSAERAFDAPSLEKAEKLVKKYKLNLIDTVELIKL